MVFFHFHRYYLRNILPLFQNPNGSLNLEIVKILNYYILLITYNIISIYKAKLIELYTFYCSTTQFWNTKLINLIDDKDANHLCSTFSKIFGSNSNSYRKIKIEFWKYCNHLSRFSMMFIQFTYFNLFVVLSII